MAQSLAQIYIHVIFSTKKRYPFIESKVESELYAYMADTIKRNKGIPFLINGTADHVHIFSSLPRTIALSKYIEDIKRNSSRWIKSKGNMYEKFAWQNGYGVFSVSASKKDSVIQYIRGQKDHHREKSFQEEFLLFLMKYGIEYDERYLWE